MSAEQEAAALYVERARMALADCGIDPESVFGSTTSATGYRFEPEVAEWVWRAWSLAVWPDMVACQVHFDEASVSDDPKTLPPCAASLPLVRSCSLAAAS